MTNANRTKRAERAEAIHKAGSSCSQAVFMVFAEELGLPPEAAHRLSCGFGAGMGRMGNTCGALTGGVMALSLALGAEQSADQERKQKTYDVVGAFLEASGARHGSTDCRGLLGGLDLRKESDRARMKAEGLSAKVCDVVIRDAVDRVEALLVQAGKLRAPAAEIPAPGGNSTAVADTAVAAGAIADIAPAGPGDAKTLAEMRYAMFTDIFPDADFSARRDRLVSESERYFRKAAGSPLQINLVARIDGIPVGCACAVLTDLPPHAKREGTLQGYVHNVYVSPGFRGRGIARSLMGRIHTEAGRRGVARLSLHAAPLGRPVYLDLGYRSVERCMELDNPKE